MTLSLHVFVRVFVFQGCFKEVFKSVLLKFKGVSRKFRWCFNKVLGGFHGRLTGVLRYLYLKEVQRVFQGSFKSFSRVFKESAKCVSRKFQIEGCSRMFE